MTARILVIKLGALGDFVLAFGPFAAIRAAHPAAEITLLTTAPFSGLAKASPWFDAVRIDRRPAWWDLRGLVQLRHQLRGFDMVYDLQTSGRSSRYHRLAGRPPWSGIAAGASHPHANTARDAMHTIERQREQLAMAGVPAVTPELGWLRAEAGIAGPYAVLVPGAAPHRPAKRWPAPYFSELARGLAGSGLRSVIVGAGADRALAAEIIAGCPDVLDLVGRTSLLQLAGVMAGAACAVGNDTGPMHVAAAVGCRSVVLFSADSDPALTAPRGNVTVLQEAMLADLPVARVAAALA